MESILGSLSALVVLAFIIGMVFMKILRNKKHVTIMTTLQSTRTMSEEDCEYFHIVYGKKIPVGAPVYSRRGAVNCIVQDRDKHNERRETTIADIKIDGRSEKDIRQRGTDLSSYDDNSLFLEELKPMQKRIKDHTLTKQERADVEAEMKKLEDEHINIDLEFTFLNSNKVNKPAFIIGIDLWNINPKRVQETPMQSSRVSSSNKVEDIVSFDIA